MWFPDGALNLWNLSYDTWTAVWLWISNGRSLFELQMWTIVVHMVWFWSLNAFLIWADFKQPKWIMKYKVQPSANVPLDRTRFWKAVRRVLENQLIWMTLFGLAVYPLMVWRGINHLLPLPSFLTVIRDFAGYAVIEEIGFYYSHRLMHNKYFYKIIHKIHRKYHLRAYKYMP
eukprot:Colp12_sorted_trinity150504_noHs@12366